MYKKQTRISSATNKTVSSGKMLSVYNSDTDRHFWFLWMGCEMVKAFFFLFFSLYMLHQRVGYSCFLTFVFIGFKMGQDLYFRSGREKAWEKVDKASDARSNEISEAFKNIKTLKLYNWTQTFTDRIKKKRTKQEDLTWTAETKNMANHGGHKMINSLLKPTIIMSGYYFGYQLSMTDIFVTCQMLDWI